MGFLCMFIWYFSDQLRETRENWDTWLWTRVPRRLREKMAAHQKHLPHLQILGIDRRLMSGISTQNHFPSVMLLNYYVNIGEAMLLCLYVETRRRVDPVRNYFLLPHVSYQTCTYLFAADCAILDCGLLIWPYVHFFDKVERKRLLANFKFDYFAACDGFGERF